MTFVRYGVVVAGGLKLVLGVLGLIGLGLGLAGWYGASRWSEDSTYYVETLGRMAAPGETQTVTFKLFTQLPPPVARYLRLAIKEGQPMIRAARLSQVGELRGIGEQDAEWRAFQARQYFSPYAPGFVWDAGIPMGPLVGVRVRDAYAAGRGSAQVRLFSLITLADEKDRPELDAGALQRYLAETAWFPTALLPGEGVTWTPIDAHRAAATLTDGRTTVSLEYHFNEAGEIGGVYTPGRYAYVDGDYRRLPWEGRFGRYETHGGMRIPMEAEVVWHLPTGKLPVWRGKITEIEYDFVQ